MKKHFKKKLAGAMLGFLGCLSTVNAIDNAHFYKATNFMGVLQRDTKDWHTFFDASYGYGSTHEGRNSGGDESSILDIYGDQNLLYLISGVPKKAGVTSFQNLIAALNNHSENYPTSDPDFGKVGFHGKFRLHDVMLDLRQNLAGKFFLELHLPVRSIKVSDIDLVDKSPATGIYSQQTGEWIELKNNLNGLLNLYGLKDFDSNYSETDVGDLTFYAGWQHVDTESFDFLKFASAEIRAGILFPTGAKDETNSIFSIPIGYNGHWGIPVRFDLSVGATNWLTIGAQGGAIFFFDRSRNRRMRTQKNQNGWIQLAEGKAKIEKGTVWDVGAYINFDHFYQGLSALVGYTYSNEEDDELHPRDKNLFSDDIVNGASRLKQWNMHNIQTQITYDFGVHMKNKHWAPRLGIFYDVPVAGQRIFNTYLVGGKLGLDFMWEF